MIDQFPLESTLYLTDDQLPAPVLNGHFVLTSSGKELSCTKLVTIEEQAAQLLKNVIRNNNRKVKATKVHLIGAEIPFNELTEAGFEDPGLSIPLRQYSFDYQKWVTFNEQCQVLVAGGGTSGALVAIGAAEKGVNTIVADFFNDPGGTKTVGGVMHYYHGFKDHLFFKEQDADNISEAEEKNMYKKVGRQWYLLKNIKNAGARFLSDAVICGAISEGSTVKGVLLCRYGRLETVEGDITVDATGDGDVAFFAGAAYHHGNSRTGLTQNYSQWDIVGGAQKLPSVSNRDYDIIDNRKISELQRGLFLSHYEAHFYNFHHFLTVRESRRIEGLYTLDLIDAVEGTHFEDVITYASSDFDPHTVGCSPFFRCGFLLPHSNKLVMEIPYRSIVPKGIDGMLISGKGFSQTHNALQFTRMSADLTVLGYLTGQIAADLIHKKVQPRDYDIWDLQKEWMLKGYLSIENQKEGNFVNDDNEIYNRIKNLAENHPEYLYHCVRLPKEKALPVLNSFFDSTVYPEGKLLLSKAMAWFGDDKGIELLEQELVLLFDQELQQGYPDGFEDNYDDIRGRKNVIMESLYWRINQNIALLAMTDNKKSVGIINHILENTTSGGKMMERGGGY